MGLKYFYDLMSQPARSLYIFLKVNNIPFEKCPIQLRTGVHMTEDFKKNLNRFGKIPFIHDGDFKLAESIAIVRYLSKKHNINNNWYPADLQQQAKVDEYLEWQHLNIRTYGSLYFIFKWVRPTVLGVPTPPEKLEKLTEDLNRSLDYFEECFLETTPFVCGDKISVADIFAASEIEQPRMAGFDAMKDRPKLAAWLARVKEATNPHYNEAFALLNKIASKKEEKLKANL